MSDLAPTLETRKKAITSPFTACPACTATSLEMHLILKDFSITQEEFLIYSCTKCKFAWTAPQPNPTEIGRYYASEDYISHSDTRKGLINQIYHRIRRYMLHQKSKLLKRTSGLKTGTLLDIGAGTGYFPAYMQEKGWTVKALEPDEGARTTAKTQLGLGLLPPEALFEQEKEQFDIVTLWHVLEHVHALSDYLRQIHTVLNPQGKLVIAVPNYTSTDARHYKQYWAAYDVPRHLWHFSPESMQVLLQRQGFRLVKRKKMPFDAFYVALLSEQYKKSSLRLVKGFLQGMRTFMASMLNVERASSLIYVFEKVEKIER